MEEMLKDVLIKDSAGLDKVFIVDNLPKSFIYRRVLKMMIDYTDIQGRQLMVPAFEVLDNGTKRQTREMVDELLPGIELSDSGDGAFVFYTDYNEARERLAAIDRYVSMNVPVAERLPERVNYSSQRGVMTASPLARHQIPRVVLPELVSPPAIQAAQVPTTRILGPEHIPVAPGNLQIEGPGNEAKQAAKDRMAKARAARKSNQETK